MEAMDGVQLAAALHEGVAAAYKARDEARRGHGADGIPSGGGQQAEEAAAGAELRRSTCWRRPSPTGYDAAGRDHGA